MRRLIDRRGAALLAAMILLCLAAAAVTLNMPKATSAVVECDGKTVLRQELSVLTEPIEVEIEGKNCIVLTIVFYSDGAAVKSSACPDKICVNAGKLTRSGETAVCLPAGVTLRLEGGNGVDATTF